MMSRLSQALQRTLRGAVLIATVVMVSSMLVGIFYRYVLNNSLAWSDEVALLSFAWVVFLSGALTVQERGHVRIELFNEALPARLAHVIEVLIWLLVVFVGIYMVYTGIEYLQLTQGQKSSAMRYPVWLRNITLPLSGALIVIYGLGHALTEFKRRVSP